MHVCVCIHILYVHTLCTYVCVYVRMYVCTYVCMHVCYVSVIISHAYLVFVITFKPTRKETPCSAPKGLGDRNVTCYV